MTEWERLAGIDIEKSWEDWGSWSSSQEGSNFTQNSLVSDWSAVEMGPYSSPPPDAKVPACTLERVPEFQDSHPPIPLQFTGAGTSAWKEFSQGCIPTPSLPILTSCVFYNLRQVHARNQFGVLIHKPLVLYKMPFSLLASLPYTWTLDLIFSDFNCKWLLIPIIMGGPGP